MLGRKSGVATQISAVQPKALVTHCHGHSLAVKDLAQTTKILDNTMGTVGEICVLVKFSPKREKMLGSIQENIEGEIADEVIREKRISLEKLCVTRWTVRAACFLKILSIYDELLTFWQECVGQKLTTDIKARVVVVMHRCKRFPFILGFQLGTGYLFN